MAVIAISLSLMVLSVAAIIIVLNLNFPQAVSFGLEVGGGTTLGISVVSLAAGLFAYCNSDKEGAGANDKAPFTSAVR